MAYNLSKFVRIAEILDKAGKFAISDKLDNVIKTSQNLFGTMPGEYAPTGPPKTGNPIIDMLYTDMSDAAGSPFAGGGMFDRFSPYKSKYGPSGPKVLPTLTPAQFAELSKTEQGRKYITQMQLTGAQEGAQFMNLSNVGLVSLGKFIAQNLAPGVARERQQEFLNNILPTTISEQVSRVLQTFPVNQWNGRLSELASVANETPQYSNQIKSLVNNSVKSALGTLKRSNQEQYNKIVKDPKYKDFATKFNV